MQKKPYYSPEEVAEYFDVSPDLIRKLCNEGKIPGARQIGKLWRIPAEYLEKNQTISDQPDELND